LFARNAQSRFPIPGADYLIAHSFKHTLVFAPQCSAVINQEEFHSQTPSLFLGIGSGGVEL
jgi:hypothetical protein